MLYRILADLVVVAHFSFIAFVTVGSLLVAKWPRLLWPHLAVVAWATAIVTVGFTCPLTPLEQHLRERAGHSSYDGGFVDTTSMVSSTPAGSQRSPGYWSGS